MTRDSQTLDLAVAAAVFLAALLSLWPWLDHPFLRDDVSLIQVNPALDKGLSPLPFFTDPSTYSVVPEFNRRHYRPLATWTLALDVAVAGRGPRGVRRTNAVLHGLGCGLLIFLVPALLRALAPDSEDRLHRRLGAAVGLLTAVHPVATLAAGYAANRALVLLWPLGMLVLLSYLDDRARPGCWRGVRTACLALLALGCKENAVMLIATVAWLEAVALQGGPRDAARRLAPLGAALIVYMLAAAVIGVGGSTVRQLPSLEHHMDYWRGQVGVVLGVYLPALLWPPTVRWEPAYPQLGPGLTAALLTAGVVAAGGLWRARRRAPVLMFCLGAAIFPMVPTFVVLQPVPAEIYRLYPGLPYLILAVAWCLRGVWGTRLAGPAVAGVAVLLASWGARLGAAGASPESLWSHGAVYGLSPRGLHELAATRRDPARCAADLAELLAAHPEMYRARVTRARALLLLGRLAEAAEELARARPGLPEDPVCAFLEAVCARLGAIGSGGDPAPGGRLDPLRRELGFPPWHAAGFAAQALAAGQIRVAQALVAEAGLEEDEDWFSLLVAGQVAAAAGEPARAAALWSRAQAAGAPGAALGEAGY